MLFFIIVYLLQILPQAKNIRQPDKKLLEKETYENITKELSPSTIIAFVGEKPITKQDIDYKKKVEIGYTNKEDEGKNALLKIIRDAVYENILYKNGITISQQELESEYERIHKETLAPEDLKKMEEAFGNRQAFLHIFVKSVLVNRKLEEFFEKNREKFDPLKKELEGKLKKIKALEISENQLGADQITSQVVTSTLAISSQNKEQERAINNLKPNEFADYIFESTYFYHLIKLNEIKPGGFRIYTIYSYEKKTFPEWLKEQMQNLNIKIENEKLKTILRREFPEADIINLIK